MLFNVYYNMHKANNNDFNNHINKDDSLKPSLSMCGPSYIVTTAAGHPDGYP